MDLWIIWIIAAVGLLIVEVMSQMVWTFCLAIGCVVALVCELFGLPLAWQLVILAIATVLAYIILVPKVKKLHQQALEKEGRKDRTGMEALLGRKATVTDEIKPGELGRVRIDGDSWQCRAPGADHIIRRGTTVTVTAFDSIILTVTPE